MTLSTGRNPPKPRLALRFGISGHRPKHLPAERLNDLKRELHDLFRGAAETAEKLHGDYREFFTGEKPSLRIVSSLAEGADRIAAHAAMECGFELQSILPFSRHDYRRDFQGAESQAEFDDLLRRASATFEVPRPRPDAIADNFSYEAAGLQMLKNCDVLIAIWDGAMSRGRGGTAEIVEAALGLGRPVIWLNARTQAPVKLIERGTRLSLQEGPPEAVDLEPGLLSHVLGKLLLGPLPEPEPDIPSREHRNPREALRWLFAEGEKPYNFGWAYPMLQWFSGVRGMRKGDAVNPPLSASADSDWQAILSALNARNPAAAERLRDIVLVRYLWADRLANYYAQLYRSSYVRNFCFAAFAVIAAVSGFLFPLAKFPLVIFELVLIAAIVGPTYTGRRRKWHERWIDYRHLAELLRPLRVLYLLGAELGATAPQHGEAGEIESHWFGWYYRATVRELGIAGIVCDAAYLAKTRELFRAAEIEGQSDYHDANAGRMQKLEKRLDRIGVALFWTTAAVCGFYIAAAGLYLGPTTADASHEREIFDHAVGFLTTACPAIGAAFYAIREQGDFRGVAERSRAMVQRLRQIGGRLQGEANGGTGGIAHLTALSELAALAMVGDLSDWRFVFRGKELSLPA